MVSCSLRRAAAAGEFDRSPAGFSRNGALAKKGALTSGLAVSDVLGGIRVFRVMTSAGCSECVDCLACWLCCLGASALEIFDWRRKANMLLVHVHR